jgi:hypothetical protein
MGPFAKTFNLKKRLAVDEAVISVGVSQPGRDDRDANFVHQCFPDVRLRGTAESSFGFHHRTFPHFMMIEG